MMAVLNVEPKLVREHILLSASRQFRQGDVQHWCIHQRAGVYEQGCSGDWNDGMDRVGRHGKGESVWLGFFLYHILIQFEKIARLRNDTAFAEQCLQEATRLSGNIETNTRDGEWYCRAWFDDGTPLGSANNVE